MPFLKLLNSPLFARRTNSPSCTREKTKTKAKQNKITLLVLCIPKFEKNIVKNQINARNE